MILPKNFQYAFYFYQFSSHSTIVHLEFFQPVGEEGRDGLSDAEDDGVVDKCAKKYEIAPF